MPLLAPEPPSAEHADKLYLVTRRDLSAGYQITQAVHAAADWHAADPGAAAHWATVSNSVVVLAAPDQRALHDLLATARDRGIDTTLFREPDLGDELTAAAFTPGPATRKLLSNLPLAGRNIGDPAPLLARERALRDLSWQMRHCEQTAGQDVLAHGRSVREHYFTLVDHLTGRLDLRTAPNWRLPAWVDDYAGQLAAATLPTHRMDRYLTLHDCGKPASRIVGADGRVHFPDHAQMSTRTYLQVAGGDADPVVADLIGGDMDIHLLKADGIPSFVTRPTAVAHLLAGLAEVTSNAAMFGGVDSVGFKIKLKHLTQRGRGICKALWGEPSAPADVAAGTGRST